jgi:hypothetical protein
MKEFASETEAVRIILDPSYEERLGVSKLADRDDRS